MTVADAFETAIIDGINIYVRDALIPKGFLNPDKVGDIACQELLDSKYKIAQELGRRWAEMIIQG